MYKFFLFAVLSLPALAAIAAETEEDSVHVYRTVKPSVVVIKNVELSGSGIVLSDDGLILTNAHVMASPMPYSVAVEVGADDAKPAVFTHVQIVGFHPALDMALIRIDPHEHADLNLVPARLSKAKALVGQHIFVIGNPGAGGISLDKSLTSGLISGVNREFEGANYYQIDAGVNHGNSGGPVCDRAGAVLGMVSLKFTNTQAIAFAIPLDGLDVRAFVPRHAVKPNPLLAERYYGLGRAYMSAADRIYGSEGIGGAHAVDRRRDILYGCACFRTALVYDPTSADINRSIGGAMRLLDSYDVAQAYLLRSLTYGAWSGPNVYRDLALCFKADKKTPDAYASLKEGADKFPDSWLLWMELSYYYRSRGEHGAAAHAAAMSLLLGPDPSRITVIHRTLDWGRTGTADKDLSAMDEQLKPIALLAELDRLLALSNEARKDRKVFMTAAFKELMRRFDLTDLPLAQDRMSTRPVRHRRELDQVDGQTPIGAVIGSWTPSTRTSNPTSTATTRP